MRVEMQSQKRNAQHEHRSPDDGSAGALEGIGHVRFEDRPGSVTWRVRAMALGVLDRDNNGDSNDDSSSARDTHHNSSRSPLNVITAINDAHTTDIIASNTDDDINTVNPAPSEPSTSRRSEFADHYGLVPSLVAGVVAEAHTNDVLADIPVPAHRYGTYRDVIIFFAYMCFYCRNAIFSRSFAIPQFQNGPLRFILCPSTAR